MMTFRTLRLTLIILVGGAIQLLPQPAKAQGTIHYVNNFNQGFGGLDKSYSWDVNEDGSADFNVRYNGRDFEIYPEDGNFVIGLSEPPPNLGSLVVPLTAGTEIGNFDYSPAEWAQTAHYNNGEFSIGVLFNSCVNLGCYGLFVDFEAPFGLQFQADGETHYGWANMSGNPFGGGTITDYAYNTLPDGIILAGQVPEPSTWALLIGGGAFLFWRCRRKR